MYWSMKKLVLKLCRITMIQLKCLSDCRPSPHSPPDGIIESLIAQASKERISPCSCLHHTDVQSPPSPYPLLLLTPCYPVGISGESRHLAPVLLSSNRERNPKVYKIRHAMHPSLLAPPERAVLPPNTPFVHMGGVTKVKGKHRLLVPKSGPIQ